jgi:anti-anti-sigma regulatory factor
MPNSLFFQFSDAATPEPLKIALQGEINEHSEFGALFDKLKAPRPVHLDLAAVSRINSSGVRQWVRFMSTLEGMCTSLVLERCSVAIVHQFNIVAKFRGSAEIRSLFLPYLCTTCEAYREVLFDASEAPKAASSSTPCTTCSAAMQFDDLPDAYLGFLA